MMLPVLPVCFCTCRVSIPEALSATACMARFLSDAHHLNGLVNRCKNTFLSNTGQELT